MKIKWFVLIFSTAAIITTSQAIETEEERNAKQAELDAICEQARQTKIAPLREKLIEECVEKEQRPDRAACERLHAGYGERAGVQQPLFYDLPECVKAHEFRTSYRQ